MGDALVAMGQQQDRHVAEVERLKAVIERLEAEAAQRVADTDADQSQQTLRQQLDEANKLAQVAREDAQRAIEAAEKHAQALKEAKQQHAEELAGRKGKQEDDDEDAEAPDSEQRLRQELAETRHQLAVVRKRLSVRDRELDDALQTIQIKGDERHPWML